MNEVEDLELIHHGSLFSASLPPEKMGDTWKTRQAPPFLLGSRNFSGKKLAVKLQGGVVVDRTNTYESISRDLFNFVDI